MSEIEFGKLLITLFSAARDFEMEIQPQLVLLQKTLLNIEGIGRHLYGELDLWATAAPFMQRWRAKKTSLPDLLAELQDLAPDLAQALPNLPRNLLLAPGRIDLITASQKRQSRKFTDVQRMLAQQGQRQNQQFGMILLSIAAIGLVINPSLGNDFTSGLSITSLIIGAVGLQQILKGIG
jgi:ubiquinone biosynthesis protein